MISWNIPQFCEVDLESELVATWPEGTRAFCHDTNKSYVLREGAWVDMGGTTEQGGQAFPVGSIFISVVPTSPTVLLGYGVWTSFAAGRVLVGLDPLDTSFDTVKGTGGAKTHTLAVTEIPSHSHVEQNNSATTGALAGWAARDTSTSTPVATGYSTQSTGGGGAHNNLQPYIVVYMWERVT